MPYHGTHSPVLRTNLIAAMNMDRDLMAVFGIIAAIGALYAVIRFVEWLL